MMKPEIAIIGAGLAGVALATRLAPHAEITLVEKSRGLGGRMATRRGESAGFDHGAQYFTIRHPAFHDFLEPAMERGVVEVWDAPLHRLNAAAKLEKLEDRSPRFVANPGMNALVRFFAEPHKPRLNTKIVGVEGKPGHWGLRTEDDQRLGPFAWIVSTAPAPQTADLLPLAPDDAAAVRSVEMHGCFTLMIALGEASSLPFSAAQVEHPVIGWIGANHSKPERASTPALVVHARNDWSQEHLEAPLPWVEAQMMQALATLLPDLADLIAATPVLHRWKYASTATPLGSPFLLDPNRHLAACGDWCIGNRVEAAFQSADALAASLLTQLEIEP
ncbi:NAD(P)/FAD-dependent oxidoreductase [Rhizobium helianthi]|uniref:NAD(P)/FAD-dependent oxidoreductase n=1 Tax=Rhizobium helianthi TaxID=1132695 RepID=A0ABW4M479_9HYPH